MRDEQKKEATKQTTSSVDTDAFCANNEIKIEKTIFLVERHFHGNRSLEEAIYETVKNEVIRAGKTVKLQRKID